MEQLQYFTHYPPTIQAQVEALLASGRLPDQLRQRYPAAHQIRSDQALYDYAMAMKNRFMRQAGPVNKVVYDDKIRRSHEALGLHSRMSRVQGKRLKSSQEIRIAALFRRAPEALLRMILAHELAHLREVEHNKAFYQLCVHIEANYHQLEFDTRLYLACLELHGEIY
ncbi:MAG: hypothetical protein RL095_3568 [Verrucomicrobiota bacterium]|jgi:predicted metal-dependent hydrolase